MNIILTPINLSGSVSFQSKTYQARNDYKFERKYFSRENDESPLWDDTCKNNAKIGNKFAFVNQIDDNMEIFDIIAILPTDVRREHWILDEHKDRRVLVLSKLQNTMKFSEYKKKVNYKPKFTLRGTTIGKWS